MIFRRLFPKLKTGYRSRRSACALSQLVGGFVVALIFIGSITVANENANAVSGWTQETKQGSDTKKSDKNSDDKEPEKEEPEAHHC